MSPICENCFCFVVCSNKKAKKHNLDLLNCVLVLMQFVSLPALNKLELEHCDFKKIWDDLPLPPTSFRNLTSLKVEYCDCIKSLFSAAVAASFEQLEILRIQNCEEMEEIVSRTENMAKISFPRLNFLSIHNLRQLTTFSSSIYIDFPALTTLYISDCYHLKTFISDSEENSKSCLFNEKVRGFNVGLLVIHILQSIIKGDLEDLCLSVILLY